MLGLERAKALDRRVGAARRDRLDQALARQRGAIELARRHRRHGFRP